MNDFSLLDLAKKGDVSETGAKPKLPIKIEGVQSETLSVYRIPLKYLYYNNENGRIRSNMVNIQEDIQAERQLNGNDLYNKKIEELVFNSNISKLNKTKKDIQKKGQLVFGYVLDDGRVIDGNRRFTALRKIEEETQTVQYFEAVILPVSYEQRSSKELVKRLELALQMGVENKVDYDPTDAAIDVYQTVFIDKLMNIGDYSLNANIKKKDVEKQLDTVFLMRDFLQFINTNSNNYQVIKDLNLYSPLNELMRVFKKIYPKGGVELETAKESAFTYLQYLTVTGGDIVRLTRDNYIKKILSGSENNAFNNELVDYVETIQDKFDEAPIKNVGEYRQVLEKSIPELRSIGRIATDAFNRESSSKDTEGFIESVRQMNEKVKDMYNNDGLTGTLRWEQFSKDDIRTIRKYFVSITTLSKDVINIYNEEIDD